jgi:hypothetical protein
MSAPHGETRASNSPQGKDGGYAPKPAPRLPHYTLLIPNTKAKHRAKASGFVFKYELKYWQNRWYVVGRPAYRRLMTRLGLRK